MLYDKSGAVAHITLNRPRVMNAYNVQMRDELLVTLEAVRDDPDVRVAVISGAGERAFCAGADLTEFGSAPSQAIARQVRWERDIWGLFLSIGQTSRRGDARVCHRLRRGDCMPVRHSHSRR